MELPPPPTPVGSGLFLHQDNWNPRLMCLLKPELLIGAVTDQNWALPQPCKRASAEPLLPDAALPQTQVELRC